MAADWLPAATLAAGVVGTLGGQGLKEVLTAGREREGRAAERDVARDAFQRDTLLELQDALLALMRNTAQLHNHHVQVYRTTDRYSRDPDPDGLSEDNRLAIAGVNRLAQRVLDDELRAHVKAVRDLCAEVTRPAQMQTGTEADIAERAEQAWFRLAAEGTRIQDHIGEVLRGVL
jgi:hypothetical protein